MKEFDFKSTLRFLCGCEMVLEYGDGHYDPTDGVPISEVYDHTLCKKHRKKLIDEYERKKSLYEASSGVSDIS